MQQTQYGHLIQTLQETCLPQVYIFQPKQFLEEEFYLLGYYALLATCFRAGLLLAVFCGPENGDDVFLRNVGWLSTGYTALEPFITIAVRPSNPTPFLEGLKETTNDVGQNIGSQSRASWALSRSATYSNATLGCTSSLLHRETCR
jgi:hypothetical protein